MVYSCTHMATVGVKGLITGTGETCSVLKERTVFFPKQIQKSFQGNVRTLVDRMFLTVPVLHELSQKPDTWQP